LFTKAGFSEIEAFGGGEEESAITWAFYTHKFQCIEVVSKREEKEKNSKVSYIGEWNLTNVGTLHAMKSYSILSKNQKHTTKSYNYMKEMLWNITQRIP
jgi:hypothetical protein